MPRKGAATRRPGRLSAPKCRAAPAAPRFPRATRQEIPLRISPTHSGCLRTGRALPPPRLRSAPPCPAGEGPGREEPLERTDGTAGPRGCRLSAAWPRILSGVRHPAHWPPAVRRGPDEEATGTTAGEGGTGRPAHLSDRPRRPCLPRVAARFPRGQCYGVLHLPVPSGTCSASRS